MEIEKVSRQLLFPAIYRPKYGVVAQLGERVPCKHQVEGSIPSDSTIYLGVAQFGRASGLGPEGPGFKSQHSDQISVGSEIG